MQLHASPDGVHFEQIAEVAYPGGKQTVEIPLTEWAREHPGIWTIRAVYAADGPALKAQGLSFSASFLIGALSGS